MITKEDIERNLKNVEEGKALDLPYFREYYRIRKLNEKGGKKHGKNKSH